jgi:cytochrome P450
VAVDPRADRSAHREGPPGTVFELRLWRPAVVGYQPEWNRAILTDLATFRSASSLSDLTPYLAAGVVHADVPQHDERRRNLSPHFHRRGLSPIVARLERVAAKNAPVGRFEALDWSAAIVRAMLNEAFFGGRFPEALLRAFLRPLHASMPWPLLPRPRLFRRMDRAIAAALDSASPSTLAASLAGVPDAVEDIRVALSAGYDTTVHTLAWLLWHLAERPEWRTRNALPAVLDEVLRLYPSGWIGSRVAARDVVVTGVPVAAGTLVLYSPYLTHHDPRLWPDPYAFRPRRFADGRPAWGFLPFGAGSRTCLGTHLARAMLHAAVGPYLEGDLDTVYGNPAVRTGLTLGPVGPLWLDRTPVHAPAR